MGLWWVLVGGASELRLPLPWDLPLAGRVAEQVEQFCKRERERVCHVLKHPRLPLPFAGGQLCDKPCVCCESTPKCDKLCVKAIRLEMLKYRLLLGYCLDLWSNWLF